MQNKIPVTWKERKHLQNIIKCVKTLVFLRIIQNTHPHVLFTEREKNNNKTVWTILCFASSVTWNQNIFITLDESWEKSFWYFVICTIINAEEIVKKKKAELIVFNVFKTCNNRKY